MGRRACFALYESVVTDGERKKSITGLLIEGEGNAQKDRCSNKDIFIYLPKMQFIHQNICIYKKYVFLYIHGVIQSRRSPYCQVSTFTMSTG